LNEFYDNTKPEQVMFLILLFISIGIFQPTENYCISFYKDSDIVYKKEDGSGGLVYEKVYLLLEKENGKKRFMIKGKMFLFDPMKHESGIVNDKKCLCKRDLTLDDLENHIDFIQSKYPFGNSKAEDLPKLILLTFKDGKSLEFYEVNWQYYNE
jgi:hypothetical protein